MDIFLINDRVTPEFTPSIPRFIGPPDVTKKSFTISPLSPIVAPMPIYARLVIAVLVCAALPAPAADIEAGRISVTPPEITATAGYLEQAREVTIHALALIGVHYKWGSDTPGQGFDCSGLVSHVFHEVAGIVLPRNSQSMSRIGAKIEHDQLQPGDLVFFNTRRQPYSHVGIYIGEERFVHAPSRGGEVGVSSMQDSYWKKRYSGARRVVSG